MYLLVFHVYINEMHGSRSKIPSKKSRPFIHISKLRVKKGKTYLPMYIFCNTVVITLVNYGVNWWSVQLSCSRVSVKVLRRIFIATTRVDPRT